MIIRRVPTDFRVEEVLTQTYLRSIQPEPDDGRNPGPARSHAVFRLSKTSLTTPEALAQLAAALRLSPGKLASAGLKDKHAVTVQHVTAALRPKSAVHPSGIRSLEGRSWRAELLGWSALAIDSAAIAHNRFVIVVRDIAPRRSEELEERAEVLSERGPTAEEGTRSLLIVNYFGDQRFGSARHGRGFAAASLVKGDFEKALRLLIGTPARKDTGKRRALTRAAASHWGDWPAVLAAIPRMPERRAVEVLAGHSAAPGADVEGGAGADRFREAFAALPAFTQSFCIEAYQSYLWNAIARDLVVRSVPADRPILRAEDDFGPMLFPRAADIPTAWRGCEVPMPSPGAAVPEACEDSIREVMAAEGLSMADLVVPGLRRPRFGAAVRPLVCTVARFNLSDPEADELGRPGRWKRTVCFDLPRGSYATVVLRALGQ